MRTKLFFFVSSFYSDVCCRSSFVHHIYGSQTEIWKMKNEKNTNEKPSLGDRHDHETRTHCVSREHTKKQLCFTLARRRYNFHRLPFYRCGWLTSDDSTIFLWVLGTNFIQSSTKWSALYFSCLSECKLRSCDVNVQNKYVVFKFSDKYGKRHPHIQAPGSSSVSDVVEQL